MIGWQAVPLTMIIVTSWFSVGIQSIADVMNDVVVVVVDGDFFLPMQCQHVQRGSDRAMRTQQKS